MWDLLTPVSQKSPYQWVTVLLSHMAIGIALFVWLLPIAFWIAPDHARLLAVWLAGSGYMLFERFQGWKAGRMLWWDSVLDWCGVCNGTLIALALWANDWLAAEAFILVASAIAFAGSWARRKSRS
ncbi:hypothetical protein [Paracoccus litorisediminis]|uniref:Uncharacterized protein n=1 Tax=Paracoccus litorisediminis TaxID=2006130 RepID=A0A844HSA6_9RHOB|nr:hypothetical protein [Paracoccus litorisediminis]MTH61217.1 hypothetical protein [Paracoccus litorisediminis]